VLGVAVVLLTALLTVPPLREAFDLGPVGLLDVVVAVVVGLAGVVWFEVYKVLSPR
jgi:Ca2+-transporting ATPase